MNLVMRPLSRQDAESIALWKYEGKYSIYNTDPNQRTSSIDYLLDTKNGFFGVYRDTELIGFCSMGRDGRVRGGSYDESAVDLGAGMRPDLTGRGDGVEFLKAVAAFAESSAAQRNLRVTIAAWNERAIRTAHRAGFGYQSTFPGPDGTDFVILVR